MSRALALGLAVSLVAIGVAGCSGANDGDPPVDTASAATDRNAADPMASRDLAAGEALPASLADDQPRPLMQMQVVLDRLGFTPGVVDGKEGLSTRNALLGFQEASELPQTGRFDEATRAALAQYGNIPATRVVTIPEEFAAGPFVPIPDKPEDQARLKTMGYVSLDEKLAERFHTTVATLHALNPGGLPAGASGAVPGGGAGEATHGEAAGPASASPGAVTSAAPAPTPAPALAFRAGQQLRVPNIGADARDDAAVKDIAWGTTLALLGVGTTQPKVAKIVVSKSRGTLKGYDAAGKLVAMFTATMGSAKDPLPLGEWKVLGVARNPPFHYNPKLFWDVPDSEEKQLLPPGPNGPVGVAWIDLSKEHYGIHGTPEPETIGRAQSHGCVRLTNWDVARLAQMVSGSTRVLFEA